MGTCILDLHFASSPGTWVTYESCDLCPLTLRRMRGKQAPLPTGGQGGCSTWFNADLGRKICCISKEHTCQHLPVSPKCLGLCSVLPWSLVPSFLLVILQRTDIYHRHL